jgi:hypothetical protein
MGEAWGHPKLTAIFGSQFRGNILPIGWGTDADIDRNVEQSTSRAGYELALCFRVKLKMQAANRPHFRRKRTIILEETDGADFAFEKARAERFHEITTCIPEALGGDQHHVWDSLPFELHDAPHPVEMVHLQAQASMKSNPLAGPIRWNMNSYPSRILQR